MVFSHSVTIAQFEQIVKQHEKLVYTICYSFTKDEMQAQDLVQETFLSAFTHIDDCKHKQYKPWLARIASNKAKDYLKSSYYKKVGMNLSEPLPEKYDYSLSGGTPLDIVISNEQMHILHTAVNSLSEPYLLVAQLYFLHSLSISEICLRLKRPKKTVHTQIYRAKNILANMLKKGGIRQNE